MERGSWQATVHGVTESETTEQLTASRVVLVVKNLPASAGGRRAVGLIPGPPGEGRATYSSVLAWRIPWTEEPGGLRGVTKSGHD